VRKRRNDILPRNRKTERITGNRLMTAGTLFSKKKPLFVVVVSPNECLERDERLWEIQLFSTVVDNYKDVDDVHLFLFLFVMCVCEDSAHAISCHLWQLRWRPIWWLCRTRQLSSRHPWSHRQRLFDAYHGRQNDPMAGSQRISQHTLVSMESF